MFDTQFDFELKHQSAFEEERINHAVDIVAFDALRLDAAELLLRAAYTAAEDKPAYIHAKNSKASRSEAFGAIAIPKASGDSLGDLNSDLLDEWREVDSKSSKAKSKASAAGARVTDAHIVATLYQIFQTTVRHSKTLGRCLSYLSILSLPRLSQYVTVFAFYLTDCPTFCFSVPFFAVY